MAVAPAPTARRSPTTAVAVVGTETVAEDKLDTLLSQVCVQYKAANKACPKPGTAERKQLVQSFVAQLVQQAEFDVAGKQLKVAIKQKDVDSSLQKLELQYAKGKNGKVDPTKWKKVLTDNHTTETNVLDNIKDGLLRQAIYAKLTKSVTVPDSAVTGVLRGGQKDICHAGQSRDPPHPGQGQGARRQDLSADRHEQRAIRGAGEEVHERFPAGRRTAASSAASRRARRFPTFDKVAFSIPTGEVSKPVKSSYGWP